MPIAATVAMTGGLLRRLRVLLSMPGFGDVESSFFIELWSCSWSCESGDYTEWMRFVNCSVMCELVGTG